MKLRAARLAVIASSAAILLAGCGFVTPQATLQDYDPSDGVSVLVGDLTLRNVLAVTADDTDANLVFTASNRGDDDVTLTIQYGEAAASSEVQVEIGDGSTPVGFGDAGQLTLEELDAAAGSLVPLYFTYGDVEGAQVLIPVLDGSLPEYAPLVPRRIGN